MKIKGILFVLLGAASYGVLATIVKLSYHQGYDVSEVTFAQFSVGFVVLWLLTLLTKKPVANQDNKLSNRSQIYKLVFAGTSLGFTGLFYYSAVQTIVCFHLYCAF